MNIPTLSSYAPAPQLAQSYATGVGLQQKDNELNANIQMEKDKLAQQAQQASLEASLKQQQIQMDAMKAAQELEVNKSYQAQSLALKHDELNQQQQAIDTKTQEAAREMQAQQMYSSDVAKAIAGGQTPAQAATAGIVNYGMALGDRAATPMAEVIRAQLQGGAGAGQVPTVFEMKDEQGNPSGEKVYQSGPREWRGVPAQKTEAAIAPIAPGQLALREPNGTIRTIRDEKYFTMKSQIDQINKDLNAPLSLAALGRKVANDLLTTPVPESTLSSQKRNALALYREKVDKLKQLTTAFENYNANQAGAAARYFQGGPQVPPSVMNTNTPAPIKRGKYTVISE